MLALHPQEIVSIQGRLLLSDWPQQRETNYHDLTEQLDLLRVLLIPGEKLPFKKKDVPCVAEIRITKQDGSVVEFGIAEVGPGRLVILGDSPSCYGRVGKAFPVVPYPYANQHLDESMALCGLIKALAEKQHMEAETIAKDLRRSAGLEK